MGDVLWKGPDPKDKAVCPYSIDFRCKPAPAKTLNSLESGRLLLTVKLDGKPDVGEVYAVVARLINKAKEKSTEKLQKTSLPPQQTVMLSNLVQDSHEANMWTGELDIPVTWVEGGTNTYARSGLWRPKSKEGLFNLEITYKVHGGSNCTARFNSEDAFHWTSAYKTKK